VLKSGFANDGRFSPFRRRNHGSSSEEIEGRKFVVCIQNHDQIGNACRGKRLKSFLDFEQIKVGAALMLSSPAIPLLFMGEEWGATSPFYYFTSHGDPGLAEAVRIGYQKECQDYGFKGEPHNPQDEAVFQASKLDWSEQSEPLHAGLLNFYCDLLTLRRNLPCLGPSNKTLTSVYCDEDPKLLILSRDDGKGNLFVLICSFQDQVDEYEIFLDPGQWQLTCNSAAVKYGGEQIIEPGDLDVPLDGRYLITLPPWTALGYHKKERDDADTR